MLIKRLTLCALAVVAVLVVPTSTLADVSDGPAADAAVTSVISAGQNNACYLGSDGSLYCWGHAQKGQLGDVSYGGATQKSPVLISGSGSLFSPTQVSVGDSTVCVLLADTKVKCWGSNGYGETGN
ncbi:MAG: hypothetical protein ACKOYL_11335, partial [Actinomycetota bacterium]